MHDDETVTALPADVQVGRQFGVYRLEGLLGAGGMVANGSTARLAPSRPSTILTFCTLYDIGPDYLVMELIDGETLSAQIRGST